jgi:glycosyltransferase involved in cell wall biosynthesis
MLIKGRVSIITPFRNTSPYLADCITSILKQDYHNWELWLIDDHSTDDSLKIAKEFSQTDSRINVLSNVDKGIIPALQLAYSKCNGEYITRMDSDDVMLPNRLSYMMSALTEYGRGIY